MTTVDKPLTAKQQAFCAAWAANGGNASAAMREAYDTSNMDDATVRKRASELLRHSGVAARIAELRAKAAEKAEITIADVLQTLGTNLKIAMGERTVKTKVLVRDKETGAVSVGEVEITDRDGGVVARTGDVLLKALGGYEVDHAQAAQAAAAARASEEIPARDLARAILDIFRTAQVEKPTAPMELAEEPEEEVDDASPMPPAPVSPAPASVAPASSPPVARPPPDRLAPGENEVLPNGAQIIYVAEFSKYGVYDGAGHLHGYKRDLAEARALAARIKPVPKEDTTQ